MHSLPHVYTVVADGGNSGVVELRSNRLSSLLAEPPPEFGGAGRQWSPEGLLCAAVASCFILSFRSVARAARLEWQDLECKVDGTLQRQDGILRFSHVAVLATLTVDPRQDTAKYRRALEQAERGCLIANSLSASRELKIEIVSAMTTSPARVVAASR
jgi:organic hydroperoxide reductase OsmC/OhrA